MKFLFLLVIRTYWALIPKSFRGKCIFKISCSNHVFEITVKKGFKAGLSALRYRFQHCRPNYSLMETPEGPIMVSSKKGVFLTEEIDERVLKEYYTN